MCNFMYGSVISCDLMQGMLAIFLVPDLTDEQQCLLVNPVKASTATEMIFTLVNQLDPALNSVHSTSRRGSLSHGVLHP